MRRECRRRCGPRRGLHLRRKLCGFRSRFSFSNSTEVFPRELRMIYVD
jgi:hypothetical protein